MSIGLCRLDAHVASFILPIMCQQRPDRSCHLVGQSHRYYVLRPTLADLLNPRARLFRMRQYRSGSVNQQRTQIGVPALAAVATMGDAKAFKSGREFAAWLGLVPGQVGTGGKVRLLGCGGCRQ